MKIIAQLVYPLGLCITLSVLALGFSLFRFRKTAISLLVVGLVNLWFTSTPVVADWIYGALEDRFPPVAVEASPPADVIVVLGGTVGEARTPRLVPDLGDAVDRLWHAAGLYRAGKAPKVIVSGGAHPMSGRRSPESQGMMTLLVQWGVPREAILLESHSRNTRENALYTKKLIERHGFEQVLLVTSAAHMPRAMASFRAVGVEPIPSPTDFQVVERDRTLMSWIPDAGALSQSSSAIKEYLGMMVYRWRGWAK